MKILIINGPNINMLGIREPKIYGNKTYHDLCDFINSYCKEDNIEVELFQSNHEGLIVDRIQESYQKYDGIIINAGAYTHTSLAILDALKSVGIKTIEVHLSNPELREEYRKFSYIKEIAFKRFMGYGFEGYILALKALKESR